VGDCDTPVHSRGSTQPYMVIHDTYRSRFYQYRILHFILNRKNQGNIEHHGRCILTIDFLSFVYTLRIHHGYQEPLSPPRNPQLLCTLGRTRLWQSHLDCAVGHKRSRGSLLSCLRCLFILAHPSHFVLFSCVSI
jgi:hypothetical protein